jgi:hypothetical protein
MSLLIKLISTIVTWKNYFATDHAPTAPPGQAYQILCVSADSKGRPVVEVRSKSYRDVPSFGTWDGMQVHTKVGKNLWAVHYEDFKI